MNKDGLNAMVALIGGLYDAAKAVAEEPVLGAHIRLGMKELGNAFDLSRDGSVAQSGHEYGMPGSLTPGEIHNIHDRKEARGKEQEHEMEHERE